LSFDLKGRLYSHINSAEVLIGHYDGDLPFHHYLRAFFREHSKYGSRDRKQISKLCYAYFRTGAAWLEMPVKEKILGSYFLCHDDPDGIIDLLKPEWKDKLQLGMDEKLEWLSTQGLPLSPDKIFPLYEHLSDHLDDPEGFVFSHLVQPRLFLRIRPGKQELVENALRASGIPHNIFDHTVELANATDVSNVLAVDKDVLVQDLSSQRTGSYIRGVLDMIKGKPKVWDCCAASGGKSILAYDIRKDVDLTVSDLRPSIMQNLKHRFERAGIRDYRSFVSDLSISVVETGPFDLVIADVPCSGSGTWGRTPEELCHFSSDRLARYRSLQEKIVVNIRKAIRPGGHLLYFTCSMYREENEGMASFITSNTDLILKNMEIQSGWESGADSMFMAWFNAPA
jgi:16S rRNA (cytosine967-C5)-methyltransferase